MRRIADDVEQLALGRDRDRARRRAAHDSSATGAQVRSRDASDAPARPVEHRERHAAEIAAARRARRVEVAVRVEPDHAGRQTSPLQSGDGRERRGAVAARDDGRLVARRDARGDLIVQPRDHRAGRTLRHDDRVVGGERVGQLRQRLGVMVRNEDASHRVIVPRITVRCRSLCPRDSFAAAPGYTRAVGKRVLLAVNARARRGREAREQRRGRVSRARPRGRRDRARTSRRASCRRRSSRARTRSTSWSSAAATARC